MSANTEPTFTQIIAEAQDQSLQLHVDFEAQFDRLRSDVSDHLSLITESTLTILLDATNDARDQSERCFANPSANLQINQLGARLSQCALLTDHSIVALTTAFFDALQRPQGASIALLSAVLDYVGRSNPVDSPAQIATDMAESLQAIRDEFTNELLPALQGTVDDFEAGVVNVPQVTRECVDEVLEQINLVAVEC